MKRSRVGGGWEGDLRWMALTFTSHTMLIYCSLVGKQLGLLELAGKGACFIPLLSLVKFSILRWLDTIKTIPSSFRTRDGKELKPKKLLKASAAVHSDVSLKRQTGRLFTSHVGGVTLKETAPSSAEVFPHGRKANWWLQKTQMITKRVWDK